MELKGYIIEKYNKMTGAYTCNRLVEEAEKLGIDLKILGVYDTLMTPEGLFNDGKLLEPRDFVINRYKWGKLMKAMNGLGHRSYNPLEAYECYVNKYEQVARLRSDAFVMPYYVMGLATLPYEMLKKTLGCPFVAKGLESSMGEEIFLIQKEEEYGKLLASFGQTKEWLFEEYVSTSYGRDIRFYSIRGEVAACMKRVSKGDFRANVALGASVSAMEITEDIRQIAADIYRQTGLDFLGIDLMFGYEKPYFCEINVMPGLEGIERASGKNIGAMIMGTIREDF